MPTDWDAEQQKQRRKELDELNYQAQKRAAAQVPIQNELLKNQLEASRLQAQQAKTQQEILDANLREARERAAKEVAKSQDPETFISGGGDSYPWSEGMLYIGRDPQTGQEVGAFTDVHALTVGASGYGKGASTIIQNLLRWPHNTVVIDAKGGENAIETAVKRAEKFDQECFVLDPFDCVPSHKIDHPSVEKVTYNPFDEIDLYAPEAKRKLKAIASGLIIRDNANDEFWQRGAENILTGLLAAIIEDRGRSASLGDLRLVIRELANRISENREKVSVDQGRVVQLIAYMEKFENDFTTTAISEIMSDQGESYLSGVISSTGWLDEPAHANFLARTSSGFNLAAIKKRRANIFLALPSSEVAESRIFLRLFVKLLLREIEAKKGGRDILFILDEFRQLGKLDEIAEKFGIFRDYNCTLWPMLQNWSQLERLYGRDGANEIRGDCRIAEFFSADDPNTCDYVCRQAGWNKKTEQQLLRPNEYAELIAKEDHRGLARRKLVFMPGKPRLICVAPQGWWNDKNLAPQKTFATEHPDHNTPQDLSDYLKESIGKNNE